MDMKAALDDMKEFPEVKMDEVICRIIHDKIKHLIKMMELVISGCVFVKSSSNFSI